MNSCTLNSCRVYAHGFMGHSGSEKFIPCDCVLIYQVYAVLIVVAYQSLLCAWTSFFSAALLSL